MDRYNRDFNHFSPGYPDVYERDFVPNSCYKSYEGGYAPQTYRNSSYMSHYPPPPYCPYENAHDRKRSEILSFQQLEDENLHETWERFKELLRDCPQHGFKKWDQAEIFYNSLKPHHRFTLDQASYGSFNELSGFEAFSLIETQALKDYRANIGRGKRSTKVSKAETNAQLTALSSKIDSLMNQLSGTDNYSQSAAFIQGCYYCGGGHRSEDCLRGREVTPTFPYEYGSQKYSGSSSLPHPQELNRMDNEPYPYDDSYYDDYGSYHDYYFPKRGKHSDLDLEPKEPYSPTPYSTSQPHLSAQSHYNSSLSPQNAQDFESTLASYTEEENDARLEASETTLQNIKIQLEQIVKLVYEFPQDIPPSNIENESIETTVLEFEAIELEIEKQVGGFCVEDKEGEENFEKLVEERVEVEEQFEKPLLEISSQEQLETITFESQPQASEQEVKNQDEEANGKDDEEEKPIEELVEENGEVEEQIKKVIMEEDKDEEEECVEPSLAMQVLEPTKSYSKKVKKNTLQERLFKFLKFTKILHFHSPLVYSLLQVPKCDEILKQLSLNRRKMKDLLKKALVGMKLMIPNHMVVNKMEDTQPKASMLHQLHKKKSRSVPLKPRLIPEGEPNPELLRHVATNSKADERVP